ncbi:MULTISPECIES: branched-chain amino acid ABC transporter permease [Actinomadura]|uniref:Amino acid/amide ABC transporter membrane protein 1, HAAT family n=1 Tax=Actinomadura madurae TaxID=1993 RepID=A0A1I5P8E6_9ACTN|nr:branched-chain amino acid ABC transporter permease [Actinomadura madurae]MCP9955388.1 branched-chain amino acid ABC transporter permease [Actinomadura madurae]MCP9984628.1 branched-chain amino acid ABC transporter permease [Actinomadura madurae]MCQ0003821.1 branched-chain amino acid ABC transporter permease [Actinomadura madurae]MCQ0020819.1 branched-chain amino acid ABC transporter permease [Actinomadura madurae]URN00840.1 branched-chain amino acid ABC transporter permease [Actinomadura ma
MLALSVVISGIAFGLVIGLLSFVLVFLYKTTGVANFAAGNIGMFETFIVYRIYTAQGNVYVAAGLGIALSVLFGALLYLVVLRPFSSAGNANILVRTVALYLLLAAMANVFFGKHQPYTFPTLLPKGGTSLGGVVVAWSDLISVGLVVVIGTLFVAMFRFTNLGLQFLAVAQQAPIARLLGVRAGRLSAVAYMIAGPLTLLIGLLMAPKQLLFSQMMDPILLYAFAAAVVGGFTSLLGTFVGGIIIGVVTSLVSTYAGGDLTLASALAIMLLTLAVRPNGLFGTPQVARL